MPDVKVFYKGERTKKSGEDAALNTRNWLKCLAIGLADIIEVHESETAQVKLRLTLGEETNWVNAYIPISVILGDNKSQDCLCGFIHCTKIVDGVLATRGCKTSLRDASCTRLTCQFITQEEVVRLHSLATRKNQPELVKQRLYRYYVPENPLFKLDYGANVHGCNTAASVDPLHSNKGGIVKYAVDTDSAHLVSDGQRSLLMTSFPLDSDEARRILMYGCG